MCMAKLTHMFHDIELIITRARSSDEHVKINIQRIRIDAKVTKILDKYKTPTCRTHTCTSVHVPKYSIIYMLLVDQPTIIVHIYHPFICVTCMYTAIRSYTVDHTQGGM